MLLPEESPDEGNRISSFISEVIYQGDSLMSGALFAFVTSLDEIVVSIFISAGDNVTITKIMFGSLRDEIDPTIATVSTLLIAGSFSIVGISSVWLASSTQADKR